MYRNSLPSIVIADDDQDDQFMLRRALEKAEVKNPIVTFTDGDDLLQFLENHRTKPRDNPPCLLFLDLNMPRLTGFDVLMAMRRSGDAKRLPTVVVSGSIREEDAARARQLGAAEYLVKFPTPAELARVIALLLDGARRNEPAPRNNSRQLEDSCR